MGRVDLVFDLAGTHCYQPHFILFFVCIKVYKSLLQRRNDLEESHLDNVPTKSREIPRFL